jgi:hypothetical protein
VSAAEENDQTGRLEQLRAQTEALWRVQAWLDAPPEMVGEGVAVEAWRRGRDHLVATLRAAIAGTSAGPPVVWAEEAAPERPTPPSGPAGVSPSPRLVAVAAVADGLDAEARRYEAAAGVRMAAVRIRAALAGEEVPGDDRADAGARDALALVERDRDHWRAAAWRMRAVADQLDAEAAGRIQYAFADQGTPGGYAPARPAPAEETSERRQP